MDFIILIKYKWWEHNLLYFFMGDVVVTFSSKGVGLENFFVGIIVLFCKLLFQETFNMLTNKISLEI